MADIEFSPAEELDPIVITAAAPRYPLPITGSFVHCLSCDEGFQISINRGSARRTLSTNRKIRMPAGAAFTHLEIVRKSTATLPTNNIVLVVGGGDYTDGALALTAPVTVASPGTLVDSADQSVPNATATQILAALTSRDEVILSNPSTATFRIGGANTVGAARGVPLAPNQTLILTTAGVIWAYQNSGSAQNISVCYTA